jgi:ADP-L-glycero-D-manno-heptose 6-epimerase
LAPVQLFIMIVLTGVSGFIGSCMLGRLNASGYSDSIVAVDDFYHHFKSQNTHGKSAGKWLHRDLLADWLEQTSEPVEAVIHLGARTDTTLMDAEIFRVLNLDYTKRIWRICTEKSIPLIYASSAATYGDGRLGFVDDHTSLPDLKPLNPYGDSKHDFDKWALSQEKTPPYWIGCKFFNVYGPNEYHKGRMASVVFHTFHQIKKTGGMRLFKSHRPDFADGHQSRDFIYITDILDMLIFFLEQRKAASGIYNFGTGKARTFLDLARNTFRAMHVTENISFIDTPEDIRDSYQYFTEADMQKVRNAGYDKPFTTLEDGISDYVTNYLIPHRYY